ncbi:MAG: MerR family DNA-binding transcriptional regulator [Methanohalobium sp.]|uniref:MerR family DNA-binding transcriptional regulator n=1 Tax=Methanohalobium sp. TaxID=2837493 RepID=UPI00397DDE7D
MYNIKQASEYLGVNPETLRRWEREGKINPERTEGGHRRYFTCKKCGQTLSRDINSAVNIAKKEMYLSGTDYKGNLKKPLYIAYWRYNNSKINMQTN